MCLPHLHASKCGSKMCAPVWALALYIYSSIHMCYDSKDFAFLISNNVKKEQSPALISSRRLTWSAQRTNTLAEHKRLLSGHRERVKYFHQCCFFHTQLITLAHRSKWSECGNSFWTSQSQSEEQEGNQRTPRAIQEAKKSSQLFNSGQLSITSHWVSWFTVRKQGGMWEEAESLSLHSLIGTNKQPKTK